MTGEAALVPVLHAGESPMVACVFGGGCPRPAKPNVTPAAVHVEPPSATHALAVLSHRSRRKLFVSRFTRTRARVKVADARILASPTICVSAWADPLKR